jgi:lipopolysaccharide export system permease protein
MANSMFPSPTITTYVAKMFLTRVVAIMLALAMILQVLDLLGESDKILEYPGNGSAALWHYVSLRAPQIIAFILPYSILLATLVTLFTLNTSSEVISMKAAGLSAHQILAPLFVAAFVVALLSFSFNDRIVSPSTANLSRWQKVDFGPLPKDNQAALNVWVRDGPNLIHAGLVHGRGAATKLEDVTVFNRGTGALDSIIRSKEATTIGTEWQLQDAKKFDVERGTQTEVGAIRVGAGIRPDQFTLAKVNSDEKSFGALWQAIGDLRAAGRPTGELESGLWNKIVRPLSAMLMPLLGAVAGFGLARSGRLFIRAVIGMALGFAYFVADNFGLAMGSLGAYPPWLAAWGPFFLFLLIGETILINTEE